MATGPVIGTAYVDVRGKTDKFQSDTEKGVLSSVTDIAKKAALAFGAAFVVGKGFSFLKDAVAEGREANKVFAQTAAVIKSTGGAAGISAKQVDDLANKLSSVTGIDDEAVASVENLLLTFTNVRNEVGKGNDVFNQATALALDMSKALGTDFKASAIQVGKALQDPIRGVAALRRVGVAFTKDQQNEIKALVNSGHALDAQKLILAELAKEFGGSAAAQATASEKLKVTWDNLKEEMGKKLIPAIDAGARLLTKVLPVAFDAAGKAGARALAILRPVFREIGQIASTFFDALSGRDAHTAFFGFLGFVADLGTAIRNLARDLAGFSSDAIKGLIDGFKGLPTDGGAATEFFGAIGRAARGLIDFFTGPEFAPVLDFVRDKFGEIVALGDKVVAFFKNNEGAAATAQAALAGVAASLAAIVVASKALKALSAVGSALSGISTLLPALASPAGLIAAAIVGIGVAAFVAYKKIQPFHDAVDKTGRFLRDTFGPILKDIGDFLVRTVPPAFQAVTRVLRDDVLPVFQAIAGFLVRNIPPAFHAVVEAAQTVARVLGPIFATVADMVGKVFAFLIREAPAVGAFLAAAFGRVADVVRTVADVVGNVAGFIGDAFTAVRTVVGQVVDFIERSGAFQFLLEQAGHFKDFIVEIAPQVVEAIGHIIHAIADVLVPAFKGAVEAAKIAFDGVKLAIEMIVTVVRTVTRVVRALWERWGDDIKKALAPLVAIVRGAFTGIEETVKAILKVILFLWDRWGDDLGKIIRGVFGPIVGLIKTVVGVIANTIRLVLDIINGDWGKAWDAFKKIIRAPLEFVKGLIKGFINVVTGILGGLGDTLSGLFHNAWDFVSDIVGKAIDGIIDFVKSLPRRLLEAAGDLAGFVGGLFGDGWEVLKKIVPAAIDAIAGFVKDLPHKILTGLGDLAGFIGGLFGDGWDRLKEIVPGAIDAVVRFIGDLPSRILEAVGDLAGLVAGLFADGWDRFKGIPAAALDLVVGFVSGLPQRILEAATTLASTVSGLFGTAWDDLKILVFNAVEGIMGFITGLPDRIGTAAIAIGTAFADLGSKILHGIMDGITGAADFVGDFGKAVANAVIGVINQQVIDRVNSALEFKIPVPFGPDIHIDPPNIPHIPSLAQGGIAPRNRPVTAVIGDNMRRDEVVAPLPPGFLKAMELIAKGKLDSNSNRQLLGDVTIMESPDGRQTFTEVVRALRASQFLMGVS